MAEKAQPKELPKLEITLNLNGSVSVHGPIHNKLQCYAMLEMARDAIKDHCDALEYEATERALREQGGIVKAPADALNGKGQLSLHRT